MRGLRWYRDPLLMIANSRAHIIAVLVGTVLVFAGIFTALEQSNPHLAGHNKAGFWVACYWAITTMTTTGYGDVSPTTLPGEFLASCLMLWSCFFLLPVVVAHVIQRLLHNPDAWTDAEQHELLTKVGEVHRHLLVAQAQCHDQLVGIRTAGQKPVYFCVLEKGHAGPHREGHDDFAMSWTSVQVDA